MYTRSFLNSTALVGCALLAGPASAQTSPHTADSTGTNPLGEIVVTAQKMGAQNLLNVPVPIGVLDASQLAEHEQVRLQDYANEVPGFIVAPLAANTSNLSIRGISTSGGISPTIGITIDDVPFVASTFRPEIDPGDLARVEVLRGPQGTLYGADSMGGLVRFVTITPSTSGYSGQLSAGISGVKSGHEVGFNLRGSLNLPLSDKLAIRVSGFYRDEPGYIHDTLTNEYGINKSTAKGGRFALMWRPITNVSVELTALIQTINNAASDEVLLTADGRTTNAPKNTTSSKLTARNFSGVVNADVGQFHLTSITGYNTLDNISRTDFTPVFGQLLAAQFNTAPYALVYTPAYLAQFSQEVRVGTKIGQHLNANIGGFYSRATGISQLAIVSVNPLTGQVLIPLDAFMSYSAPSLTVEYAGFADATYHFSDRFDVQVGGRLSHLSETYDTYFKYGTAQRPNPLLIAPAAAKSSPFTYLVTPRFQVTPNIMVYARAASGYRPGAANRSPGVPPQFDPDKTYNYEMGMKGRFLDGKLTADISLYHIDWKQIQLTLRTAQALPYGGNGGSAKSEGVEFSMAARLLSGTKISGWIDYDKAVLTSDLPGTSTYGKSGDALPLTPKLTGHITLRQDVPISQQLAGFVEASANYRDSEIGTFQRTPLRQIYPSYTQVDLRAGATYRSWQLEAYVNNVGNTRGILNGGLGYANPLSFVLIRQRTFGASVTAKF